MIIRVCDMETSDMPPDGRVCEIGWTDIWDEDGVWHVGEPYARLVNPGKPIEWAAMAVHHIMDEDVANAPPFTEVAPLLMAGPPRALAAHKASFEQAFFTTPATWLCTWKLALHLAPNSPGWSNQILRYFLRLDVDRAKALPPHRAGPDSYVTAHLLARMLGKITLDEAIAVSSRPALLPKFTFGKWAMRPVSEIDTGYLEWMAGQKDMDADAVYTAKHHIALRRDAKRSSSPVSP